MAALSDYLEAKVLNWALRGVAMGTAPATVHVALYTVAPNDAGGGTEVSGGSYARASVNTTGGFNAPTTGGLTDNAADITFPTPTANWGTIVAVGVLDAASGGNLLFHGGLTTSKTVNNGDPAPKFTAGQLDITLN